LLFCPDPSRGPGRYHRAGGSGAWYASSTMRASWCELFRHFFASDAPDPFEVRRRAGRARIEVLRLLDLTDPQVRSRLGVEQSDVVADDYELCQALADAARAAGLDGLLAPSAGLPGNATLALFSQAVDSGRVVQETSRVQAPPLDLVRVLPNVRSTASTAEAFQRHLTSLIRLPYRALRRRYRRR